MKYIVGIPLIIIAVALLALRTYTPNFSGETVTSLMLGAIVLLIGGAMIIIKEK